MFARFFSSIMKTKFNAIVKNIEDNPDSSITSIRVYNVDRLFTVMNRDHRLNVGLDTYDDDSDHPFYEDYSVL